MSSRWEKIRRSLSTPPGVEPGRLLLWPRWSGPDGMASILAMAVPLILASAVHAVNQFFDRTFLAWYSQDAFTAALQGAVMFWAVMIFFHQTVFFSSTFIAQYIGARAENQVGPMLWQAKYLAIISGLLLAVLSPLAFPFFRWIGHEGDLPRLEAEYLSVMMLGSLAMLLNTSMYGYFTGRGRMSIAMFINAAFCTLNICLNIWMIFTPVWIFPEGIRGAAWATVLATAAGWLMFLLFALVEPRSELRFHLLSGWRYRAALMGRLLRFGVPAGFQGLIDLVSFTTLVMVIGLFGYQAQYASNLAFNINWLLFIPAIGMHDAARVLSGQFCGASNHSAAERMTVGVVLLISVYMAFMILIYLVFPEPVLEFFRGGVPEAEWQEAVSLAKALLLFVAFYTVSDGILLAYSGTLKGAGDTQFVMWTSFVISQVTVTVPCLLLATFRESLPNAHVGLYLAWGAITVDLVVLAVAFLWRFRQGGWKAIKLLETSASDPQTGAHFPLEPQPTKPSV